MRLFRIVFLLVGSLLWLCIEQDHQLAHAQDEPIIPIPGGCIRPTPNELPTETLCCISGFVYMNGEIVEGAEVKIQSTQGHVTLLTHIHENSTDKRPYYKFSLTSPPLNVSVGDTITLTARYSGYEHTITYIVQPGGQQVDIVIPPPPQQNYVFADQVWNWDSENRAGQFFTIYSIAADSVGNIYVGDRDNPHIQIFSSDGSFLKEWQTIRGNLPGQIGVPTDIAIDRYDYVYIADQYQHRIHKFSSDGEWITSFGEFGSDKGQLWEPVGIAIDAEGKVYVADSYNHRVQVFAPQKDGTYRYYTHFGTYGSEPGQLKFLGAVAVTPQDDIFVADYLNRRIQKFIKQGEAYVVVDPQWGNPTGNPEKCGTLEFLYLYSIELDSDNNIYIVDPSNDRVLQFDSSGNLMDCWGKPNQPGTQLGEFYAPMDIFVDNNNNLLVADTWNERIQKKNPLGEWQAWGKPLPVEKRFARPQSADEDADGNLYILDTVTDRVYKRSSIGTITSWGGRGSSDGQFFSPSGLVVDVNNGVSVIYIADTFNHRIQKCSSEGICTTRWGKADSTPGSNNGEFSGPRAIAVDSQHNFYIVDYYNNRIQKCVESDNCTTLSLSNTVTISLPTDIVVDSKDNLYIADQGNERVLQVKQSGEVNTWITFTVSIDPYISSLKSTYLSFESTYLSLDRADNLYLIGGQRYAIEKFDSNGKLLLMWGYTGSGKGQFLSPRHIIEAFDGKFYMLESHRISIFQPATYTSPVPTINYINQQNGTLLAQGQGQASASASSITEHLWQLSNFSTTVTITTPTLAISTTLLSPGSYTLTYQVRNEQGSWSKPVSTCCIAGQSEPVYEIYVPPAPQRAWTMLLYLVGDFQDDGTLINSYERTLNQLKRSFSNTNVCIAIQVDGPAHGDTRQLLFLPGVAHQDRLLEREQAMDTPETLTKFLRWGQTACPAQHYYLAIADHGQAIQGIGWDMNSADAENYLTIADLVAALNATDVAPIDVLHLDGCSMNLIEVAYELRNSATYLISSQYLGWSYFAYDDYQSLITAATTPEGLARHVVARYAELASADNLPFTLTALNLTQVERVVQRVDALSVLLKAWVTLNPDDFTRRQAILNTIRGQSQLFNSNHDLINTAEDAYVDLLDWASNLRDYSAEPFNQAIRNAASTLINEIQASGVISPLIVANQTASHLLRPEFLQPETRAQYPTGAPIDLAHANGVSIYYPLFSISSPISTRSAEVIAPPPDKIFYDYINETTQYTSFVLDFTQVSRWNEFLKAAIGTPTENQLVEPPGPLPVLDSSRQLYLPIVYR